ncbi:MAG TPA: PaaI family thioesterase [Candidatus Binatus sp.]|nr:PaaI family thioesterase [Candidatus Binatus sp.]
MAERDRSQFIKPIENAPFTRLLGLKIESATGGVAVVRMPFDLHLLNEGGPRAPLHGGSIAALVDVAACAAVWSMPETTRSATISLTVNYTGFAVNSDLIAHAKVKRAGKRIASISVEVADDANALIADALVTYKII